MKTLLQRNSNYFDPIVYHIGSNLSDPPKITSQPFSATKEEPRRQDRCPRANNGFFTQR